MTMKVNGKDLALFGCLVGRPHGYVSAPGRSDSLLAVPGRLGQLRTSREWAVAPRPFTVQGTIRAASNALLRAAVDALVAHLAQDDLTVWFSQWPDREAKEVGYRGMDWQDLPHEIAGAFTLNFLMSNPVKYALFPDFYTILNGAEQVLTLGSAPSDVHLRFVSTGDASPQVHYKDAQGMVRGSIVFDQDSTDFPVNQWIDWDGTWQLGTKYAYVAPNVLTGDAVPTVDSLPFVADPQDGAGTTGPSLLVQNCNVEAFLWKAWW